MSSTDSWNLFGGRYRGLRNSGMVIDIGEAYTKVGFSGESSPRCIIPTNLEYKGEPVYATYGTSPLDLERWVEVLVPLLKKVYFEYLQVNPGDRRVIVLENKFWPYTFKKALATCLFDMQVPSILFLPCEAVPIYASGEEDGLVVDVGFMETRVTPIGHGIPLIGAQVSCPVGMHSIHQKIEIDAPDLKDVDFSVLEDVICRTCFVRPYEEKESKCKDAVYQVSRGTKITVPGACRGTAADALFGENVQDDCNIAHCILDALLKCDADQRPLVISNVIICGGTVHLPGFPKRLCAEISAAFKLPKYEELKGLLNKFKYFETPFPYGIIQWIGGAVVGTLDLTEGYIEKTIWREFLAAKEAGEVDPNEMLIPDWTTAHLVESESETEEDEGDEGDGSDYENAEVYLL